MYAGASIEKMLTIETNFFSTTLCELNELFHPLNSERRMEMYNNEIYWKISYSIERVMSCIFRIRVKDEIEILHRKKLNRREAMSRT